MFCINSIFMLINVHVQEGFDFQKPNLMSQIYLRLQYFFFLILITFNKASGKMIQVHCKKFLDNLNKAIFIYESTSVILQRLLAVKN